MLHLQTCKFSLDQECFSEANLPQSPLPAVSFHHEVVSQHVNRIPLDETKSTGIIQESNHSLVQLPGELHSLGPNHSWSKLGEILKTCIKYSYLSLYAVSHCVPAPPSSCYFMIKA